jgi:hypothetical protein
MSCVDVGVEDEAIVLEFQGQLREYDFATGKMYPAMTTREILFDLSCEGEVLTVANGGVVHRWPLLLMTTLCGVDFDRSWKPGSGIVTCKRCLARSRKP